MAHFQYENLGSGEGINNPVISHSIFPKSGKGTFERGIRFGVFNKFVLDPIKDSGGIGFRQLFEIAADRPLVTNAISQETLSSLGLK